MQEPLVGSCVTTQVFKWQCEVNGKGEELTTRHRAGRPVRQYPVDSSLWNVNDEPASELMASMVGQPQLPETEDCFHVGLQ